MTTSTLRAATAAALRGDAPVRGLTVRQPWGSAITYLGKRIENRPRLTRYTGLTMVHVGKEADTEALREAPRDLLHRDVRSAVLSVACITGCHPPTLCGGRCSTTWSQPGRVHWQLADVLDLAEPVPAPGVGRLYLWTPSPELRHAVAVALEKEKGGDDR